MKRILETIVSAEFQLPQNISVEKLQEADETTKDVCPEKFESVDLSSGYPFFYKGITRGRRY